jgi:hypothetical protein
MVRRDSAPRRPTLCVTPAFLHIRDIQTPEGNHTTPIHQRSGGPAGKIEPSAGDPLMDACDERPYLFPFGRPLLCLHKGFFVGTEEPEILDHLSNREGSKVSHTAGTAA